MGIKIPHASLKQNHYWGKISLKDSATIVQSSICIHSQAHGFEGKEGRTIHSEVVVYSGDEYIHTFSQEFPYATWKKYTVDEILRGMEGNQPKHSILVCDWLNWETNHQECMRYYRAMRDFYDSLIPQLSWWKRQFSGFYDVPELIGHIIWAIRKGIFGAKKPLPFFDLPWGNGTCMGSAAKGIILGTTAIGKPEQFLFPEIDRERIYPALGFRDPHFIDFAA